MTDSSHSPETGDLILIGGPTASGKSSLALDLADHLGGVVINADSMQVYREFSLLTARPAADDLARAPHRLYGHRPGNQPCSMADWHREASAAVADARSSGHVPIIVGGTGLYLRAMADGFSDIPAIPPDIRPALAARREADGPDAFF